MSSGVIIPDPVALQRLYDGAMVGQSLAKSLATGAATGQDINLSVRQGLLNAGLQSGKLNPGALSPSDKALIQSGGVADLGTNPLPKPGGGGFFNSIGNFLGKGLDVVGQNATGFFHDLESVPQGLFKTGEGLGAYAVGQLSGHPISAKEGAISPGGLVSGLAKGVASDFSNITPGTAYRPLLDIAGLAGGGSSLVGKGAAALSRSAEAGRAVQAGADLRGVSATLGRSNTVQRLADASRRITNAERPPIPIHPDAVAQSAMQESQVGQVPRFYSVSPFRRFLIEHPTDALMQHAPGIYQPIRNLQAKYNLGRLIDTTRGRITAGGLYQGREELKPFEEAYARLKEESLSPHDTELRHQATILKMMIEGGRARTPEEALQILEQYQHDILQAKGEHDEMLPSQNVVEDKAIREYRDKLYSEPAFRQYFAEPTQGMRDVANALHESVFRGLRKEGIDPWLHIQNSLARMSHLTGKTTDQLLGELPEEYTRAGIVAKGIDELQQALHGSAGEDVPQEALVPQLAASIPGGDLVKKIRILQEAIWSMKQDITRDTPVSQLLNDPSYLQGRTLTQKVAQALAHEGIMDPHQAERFMAGAGRDFQPTYFPSVDSHGMKYINTKGPLGRATRMLRRLPQEKAYREFKGGLLSRPPAPERIMRAQEAGLIKAPTFLHEADYTPFKQGIDRIDVTVFARHVISRERHVVASLLAPKALDPISLKDAEGNVLITKGGHDELATRLGSERAARQWMPMPERLIGQFLSEEDHNILTVLETIRQKGSLSEEDLHSLLMDQGISAKELMRDALSQTNFGSRWIPVEAYNRLVRHAKLGTTSGKLMQMEQWFIGRWRHAVLAMMPSWWLRTTVGHGLIMFIGGVGGAVDPTRFVSRTARLVRQSGKGEHEGEFGLTYPGQISYPAGIVQGQSEGQFADTAAQRAMRGLRLSQVIQHGVHETMSFQRKAAFINRFEKVSRQHYADLQSSFEETGKIFKRFNTPQEVQQMIARHPEWADQAAAEVDRISYTFGQMGPWERWVAKNAMPFYGWYKFASKYAWSLPMNYPGRAALLAQLGEIGEHEQLKNGPIPDWLRNSILYDTGNQLAHYISMQGVNPLGDTMDPFGAQGQIGVGSLLQLGQLNPITQSFIEGMGYNTLTGGQENIDPTSGIIPLNGSYYNTDPLHPKEYSTLGNVAFLPRFAGSLLRSFPEIRYPELLYTRGRNVYPESIPFLNEKLVPTTHPKPASLGNLGLQFLGVAPKQYALQQYQQNLFKKVIQARRTQFRDIAKQKVLNP